MSPADWVWVPIVLWAALAQTARSAAPLDLVSRRLRREKLAPLEQGGLALVVVGLLAPGLQL